MMTVEEALVAHLRWYDAEVAPLIGAAGALSTPAPGKLFAAMVPEEILPPVLVYELTGQEHGMSHSGPTGLIVSDIAVHCLVRGQENYATAKLLGGAVHDALEHPAQMWGDVPVARKHAVVSGGVWSVETQNWIVTVTVTLNHNG